MLVEKMFLPVAYVKERTFTGLWNNWLLLYGNISSELSYMNNYFHIPIFLIDETVLDRFSKFKMSSISIPWSFSLSITTFSTGPLKIKLQKSEIWIVVDVEYCTFRKFLHICFFSCQNICKESKSSYQKMIG